MIKCNFRAALKRQQFARKCFPKWLHSESFPDGDSQFLECGLVLVCWCLVLVQLGAWCLVRLGAGVGEGIRGSDGELGPRVHQQIVLKPRGMFNRWMFPPAKCSTGHSQVKGATNVQWTLFMSSSERAQVREGCKEKKRKKSGILPNPPRTPHPQFCICYGKKILFDMFLLAIFKPLGHFDPF